MDSSDHGLLRDVILWLYGNQARLEREDRSGLDEQERMLYELIATKWKRVESDRALAEALEGSAGTLIGSDGRSRYIYLEPTRREKAIPIFSFSYDWTSSLPYLSLKLALFLLDTSGAPAAVGYRFEAPHGLGDHHFYHAQPIQSLAKDGVLVPQCPNWLPVRHPAFILDATDPISLMVSLLISVYGIDYVDDMGRQSPFGCTLISHVETRMKVMDRALRPTFWSGRRQGETLGFMTRHDKRHIKLIARTAGIVDFKPIDWRRYRAMEEAKRKVL